MLPFSTGMIVYKPPYGSRENVTMRVILRFVPTVMLYILLTVYASVVFSVSALLPSTSNTFVPSTRSVAVVSAYASSLILKLSPYSNV